MKDSSQSESTFAGLWTTFQAERADEAEGVVGGGGGRAPLSVPAESDESERDLTSIGRTEKPLLTPPPYSPPPTNTNQANRRKKSSKAAPVRLQTKGGGRLRRMQTRVVV